MQVERRRPDIAVLDGIFGDGDQAAIEAAVGAARFETQVLGQHRIGRARERAVIEDEHLADILWQRLGAS